MLVRCAVSSASSSRGTPPLRARAKCASTCASASARASCAQASGRAQACKCASADACLPALRVKRAAGCGELALQCVEADAHAVRVTALLHVRGQRGAQRALSRAWQAARGQQAAAGALRRAHARSASPLREGSGGFNVLSLNVSANSQNSLYSARSSLHPGRQPASAQPFAFRASSCGAARGGVRVAARSKMALRTTAAQLLGCSRSLVAPNASALEVRHRDAARCAGCRCPLHARIVGEGCCTCRLQGRLARKAG